ncbi:MAG: DUF1566 domain-containing protein [Bacteroidetes bacterium]|jgi:hypothetical protein|nr:DUF1566 domain-containing protein [Bacteroidota bacterium]MBT5529961.1 DUF1566 domain-containing protein [Cytophagia bacterium]MBT3422146.1 DUF1566 domain-containing protein [Bacteroidota bacterium]MBT3800018.1 DUF1566 domain-containing protein [Bacteroidota bacterium]MBT3932660.1 DUF1566 domain-containing protein [Bacteroidota bacterium]
MKNILKRVSIIFSFILVLIIQLNTVFAQITFSIVDTDQKLYYDSMSIITAPTAGQAFYGQDAHYTRYATDYTDNGDGTVTDNVTGLMWQKSPDLDWDGVIDYDDKLSYDEAMAAADTFGLAGYSDWRLPSIKEMYSLIVFSGKDPSGYSGTSTAGLVPYIDTNYFDFGYGDLSANERLIDAQMASSNIYVGTTMMGAETMFGVNFADGRIKGYPTGPMPGQSVDKQFYIMYVRGNTDYGKNNFKDNGDKTITDNATGLMWTQDDDGSGMTWEAALSYAENATIASHSDWRLPNVKELQSIVDYTRSPSTSSSSAIDPLFSCTKIKDEGGNDNYAQYWSGTTHATMQTQKSGGFASYVCFGEGLGFMEQPPNSGNYTLMDVHGAGCQRSDPKVGDPADYPNGHGPQGDVIRIYNYVRLVRDAGTSSINTNENDKGLKLYPNPAKDKLNINFYESEGEKFSVSVINAFGEVVYRSSDIKTINIEGYDAGIYIVRLESDSRIFAERFIKE